MSVLGSPAVVVEGVVERVVEDDVVGGSDALDGAAVLDVAELPATPGAEVGVPDPLEAGAAGEPDEQDATRVTARAAAVTVGSGRMGAECRSP